jgi:hypothetical protein
MRRRYRPNPIQTKTLLYAGGAIVAIGAIGTAIYYAKKKMAAGTPTTTTPAGTKPPPSGGGGYTPYTALPHTDPLSALNAFASAYGQGGVQGSTGLITATGGGGDGGATFDQP